jgi:hypothetical protein
MVFPGRLFSAVGDPEEVIEFLRVARVGVIGAFMLVLDVGAGGLHAFSCFACGVGGAAVDRASGSFWKGGGGEGQRDCQHHSNCGRNRQPAEDILIHLVLYRLWC